MARTLTRTELESFPALDWPDVAPRITAEVRAALEAALASLDGGALNEEQALRLAHAEGEDLLGLLVAADRLRRARVGDVVTYVVNRNINFTLSLIHI